LPALLAVLLAVYALAGFWGLPALVRHELSADMRRAPGAHLAIGALTFNPFTLNAQAGDVALSGTDGAPLLGFQRLQIIASISSLWQRAWVFKRIELDAPLIDLHIAHDGSVNLARLLAALRGPPSATTPSAATSAPASVPRVRIGALLVHAGTVHFQDLSRAAPFATSLSPIEIALQDFRTQPDFDSPYHCSARVSDGSQLDWSGTLSVQPLASTGQFSIAGVAVSTLSSYLAGELPVALRGGILDLQGNYRFRADTPRTLAVTLQWLTLRGLLAAPAAAATATAHGAIPAAATAAATTTAAATPIGATRVAATPVVTTPVVTTAGAEPPASPPASPWISLPRIDVAGASVDLIAHRIDVQQITLQAPSLEVDRAADGSVTSLSAWSTAAGSGGGGASGGSSASGNAAGSSAGAAGASWAVTLGRLSVNGGLLELVDHSVQPAAQLRVAPLAFSVSHYASDGTAPLAVDLMTGVGRAGGLTVSGSVALAPLRGSLQLGLQHFDLTALQPYLARQTAMTLYRGQLTLQSTAQLGGAGQLQVGGSLTASNFAARDNASGTDFITGRAVQISGLRYREFPAALSIGRVLAQGVSGRVIIGADGKFNLAQILRPQHPGTTSARAASVTSTSAGKAPAVKASAGSASARNAIVTTGAVGATSGGATGFASMPISIGRVDIRGSAANFTDHSVQPNFSAAILGLRGSIVGLSSNPKSRAQVQLQGSVDQYAPVKIDGQVNLLSAATYTDLGMTFSNIDLTIFNPYSGKFAGYSIAQGKLTTQMHYHVENRQLEATHHIEIDQLEFGPATETKPAVPLPVRFAAAMLKDRRGVISLDLPVSGTLSDPSFRLGPIIWKVFTGLIRHVVTAPFAFLGSLFGGNGQQLAYVDFPAGSAALAADQTHKLTQLAQALAQRPQLKLDIPLHTLSVLDDQALAHGALEAAVQQTMQQAASGPAVAGTAAAGTTRGSAGGGRGGSGEGRGARRGPKGAKGVAPPPRLAALQSLYQQKFHAVPSYPADMSDEQAREGWLEQQLLPQFAPGRQQRDALARARADAAEAAVLADKDVPPMRVFLTNATSGSGAGTAVRMQLQLE
jgi:uncharacterized protein involved in outer membrane biogenesis